MLQVHVLVDTDLFPAKHYLEVALDYLSPHVCCILLKKIGAANKS